MGYKLDLHVHTIVSSACGHSTPRELVDYYKECGFDGICITDHFYLGNTSIDRSISWEEWVKAYAKAWELGCEEGKRVGLDVFFGWETSYAGEDFLILGLTPEWLIAHPDITVWNQAEQYEHVHADGGFVIQAHPFRERPYMTEGEVKLHPYHADAWEVANVFNKPYQNRLAYETAKEYGIPMTAGSDIHRVGSIKYDHPFGIELEQRLTDIRDLKDIVLSGRYRLIDEPAEYETEPLNPAFDVVVFNRDHERVPVGKVYYPGRPKAEDPRIRK